MPTDRETPAGAAVEWLGSAGSWTLSVAACAAAILDLGLLCRWARNGLDSTDEGLYLLAADNHQPAAGYIGLSGRYTGLLFGAVGFDIAWFRIAGVLLIAVSGAVLGFALGRILERHSGARLVFPDRVTVVLGTTCGCLAFYSLYLRSPSYNWLTLVGAVLAAAAGLLILTLQEERWRASIEVGGLLAVGVVLAFWGKPPAGPALALLVATASAAMGARHRPARARALVAAIAGILALLTFQAVFVADPATTVGTLQRSIAMWAVVSPDDFRPVSAVRNALRDAAAAPGDVFAASKGLVLFGLAPLLALAASRPHRPVLAAGLGVAAVLAVAGWLIASGGWSLGSEGYLRGSLSTLAVVWTAALSAAAGTAVLRRSRAGGRELLLAGIILVGAAVAYAFGSNNGIVAQLNGAAGLLFGLAVLLIAASVRGRLGNRAAAGASIASCVISVVILCGARAHPYRMAAPEAATDLVQFGPRGHELLFDPATAGYWREVTAVAAAGGWRPGTRLLDLSWTPALAYALDATVPETLVPTVDDFPGGTAAALESLQGGDPVTWSKAWLVTSPNVLSVDAATVVAAFGRSFPLDYDLVGQLTIPESGLHQQVWRPRSVAGSR